MKKYNINQIIASFIAACVLSCFLFTAEGFISKIIILLFLIFALTFLLSKIFSALDKKALSEKIGKAYVTAFSIFWFGFLIYWDYVSLMEKNYMSLAASYCSGSAVDLLFTGDFSERKINSSTKRPVTVREQAF